MSIFGELSILNRTGLSLHYEIEMLIQCPNKTLTRLSIEPVPSGLHSIITISISIMKVMFIFNLKDPIEMQKRQTMRQMVSS